MLAVLGANGMLGSDLCLEFAGNCYPLTRSHIDIASPTLRNQLDCLPPITHLINAAAYTKVDLAEDESDMAHLVNADAVGIMANWCRDRGVTLVHFSTEYVFDGLGVHGWTESDLPNPINAYGQSKWKGEMAIQSSGCAAMMMRVQWLYGENGTHFVSTIRRLLRRGDPVSVVDDQWGCPTPTRYVAKMVRYWIEHQLPLGILHLSGDEWVRWVDVASRIAAVDGKVGMVKPVPTTQFPRPAKRPANGRLSHHLAHSWGMPSFNWQNELIDYLRNMN